MYMRILYFSCAIILFGCISDGSNSDNAINPSPSDTLKIDSAIIDTLTEVENTSIMATCKSCELAKYRKKYGILKAGYRDKLGLKQGIWDSIQSDSVIGFVNYSDGIPNGAFHINNLSWPYGEIFGVYKNGKLYGPRYARHKNASWYHIDNIGERQNHVLTFLAKYCFVKYHIMDSCLLDIDIDTSGTRYIGLYYDQKPIGVHEIRYPNNNMKIRIDYDSSRVIEYSEDRNIIYEGSISDYK